MGFKTLNIYGADHSWSEDLRVDNNNRVCKISRHFYDEVLLPQISDLDEDDFLPLMEIFNEIVALRGPEICENINKEAYDEVKNMMNKNNIKMTVGELQSVAA